MRHLAQPTNAQQSKYAQETASTILMYLKGRTPVTSVDMGNNITEFGISERLRRFMCWGVSKKFFILAQDGSAGLQITVSGALFQGRVRIWLNGGDLFDVEYLYARKDEEKLPQQNDVFFEDLQNIINATIERTDDPDL